MFKENFSHRHIGPNSSELEIILKTIGVESVEELLNQTIPDNIRLKKDLDIPEGISEMEFLNEIKKLSYLNKNFKTSKFLNNAYGTLAVSKANHKSSTVDQ